jgi:hypothetical protein
MMNFDDTQCFCGSDLVALPLRMSELSYIIMAKEDVAMAM